MSTDEIPDRSDFPELPPTLQLRAVQLQLIAATVRKLATGERLVVGDICPGSGKTLAFLLAAAVAFLRGYIDAVAIFVPRLNLAWQVEGDWERVRGLLGPTGGLGPIAQRENIPPFLRDGAVGYVTTYQALHANPDLHVHFALHRRTLVVYDEAQQLGVDEAGGGGTRTARLAARLSAEAALTVLVSGTPYRADGNPLLLAEYGPPDATGLRPLLADVRATYRDGVAAGYLREFEFLLHNGVARWDVGDGAAEDLELARLDRRIWRIIREPAYWQALVDRGVRQVRALQADVDPRLCGLIAAANQQHARAIAGYLARRHPTLRVLLATQDEREAHANLRRFRQGAGDILIAVAMAHMGYDHPPISVIVPLTTTRQEGWLRQLIARALRVMPDLPLEMQLCYLVAPGDPGMVAFGEGMRRESAAGVLLREEREERPPGAGGEGPEPDPASAPPPGVATDAALTTVRALGLDPGGDVDPAQLVELLRLCRVLQIPAAVSITKLAALVRAARPGEPLGAAVGAPAAPRASAAGQPGETAREREHLLRRIVARAASAYDTYMLGRDPAWTRGDAAREAKRRFGTPVAACGEDELRARLAYLRALHQAALAGDDAAMDDRGEPEGHADRASDVAD
jgi:superfamily II DNA or RNA helicase